MQGVGWGWGWRCLSEDWCFRELGGELKGSGMGLPLGEGVPAGQGRARRGSAEPIACAAVPAPRQAEWELLQRLPELLGHFLGSAPASPATLTPFLSPLPSLLESKRGQAQGEGAPETLSYK